MELINWRIPTRHPQSCLASIPRIVRWLLLLSLYSHLMPKITKQFRPPTMRWRNKHIFMQKLWCLGSRERRWEKYPNAKGIVAWSFLHAAFMVAFLRKITSTSTPIVMRRSEKWEKKENVENVIFIHVRSVQLPARNRKDKKASLSALGLDFLHFSVVRLSLSA